MLKSMNRDMDARYHQSVSMCSSLYKKMHPAAVAATRKAIPSSLSGLLLSNPFSRNVADAGSLNEFDAGHFSVCLFQDPLLYEDGQGYAAEMTPNFKFICKHLLKRCQSAWYSIVPRILKNRTKESLVPQAAKHFHS